MRWGFTSTTPTSGGPLGGGLAVVFLPQPVITIPVASRPATVISFTLYMVATSIVKIICFHPETPDVKLLVLILETRIFSS
jgi:hypothetical protein